MSFRDIGQIIKEYKEEIQRVNGQPENKENDDIRSKSKTIQAIKLFSEDKNLVDVVIALDLPPDEVQEMYQQFLKLTFQFHSLTYELVRVFDEMQNYLPSLLELFRLIVHQGLNKDDIVNLLKIINTGRLQYLQTRIQSLTDAGTWLENQIKKKEYHLKVLDNRVREGSIIPMTNTTNELTYRADNLYPSLVGTLTRSHLISCSVYLQE